MISDRKIYFAALAVVVILFFGSCIYGYTASIQMPEAADEIVVTFQSSTTELDSSAPAQLSWQIFFNNLKVCLILFLGGMTFGAATLFVLVSNGYVIGSISGVMLRGYDVSVFAATIVPHGIFEIAAILMSAALGLQMGRSLYLDAQGRDEACRRDRNDDTTVAVGADTGIRAALRGVAGFVCRGCSACSVVTPDKTTLTTQQYTIFKKRKFQKKTGEILSSQHSPNPQS